MADQEADQLEEGQEELDEKSTLAYKMAHPEEAPGFKPPGQDQETQEEKEAREAVEAEAAAAAKGPEGETAEQKTAREVAEAEAAADKTKDWTVEDFRRGYKEAETRMHTATEETAAEKKAREAADERTRIAEEKLAEKERLEAEAARPKPLTEEEEDAVFEKAAQDLDDLDRTDPDYLKNYARIMRKAVKAVAQSGGPDTSKLAEETAQKAWDQFQGKQAAESAKTAEERQRENQERLNQQAIDFAKQQGLNMTPGSADYRLFWDIANNDLGKQEFMKGDTLPSLEEQFKWCADQARAIRGQVVEQTDAERQAALAAQKNNAVLGKGVQFDSSKVPPKKRSLSEMQEERASSGDRL